MAKKKSESVPMAKLREFVKVETKIDELEEELARWKQRKYKLQEALEEPFAQGLQALTVYSPSVRKSRRVYLYRTVRSSYRRLAWGRRKGKRVAVPATDKTPPERLIPQEKVKEMVAAALGRCGRGALVKRGYNTNSLYAVVREYEEERGELPPSLAALLNIEEVYEVRSTKAEASKSVKKGGSRKK